MGTEVAVIKSESEAGADEVVTPKDARTLAEYSPVHRAVEVLSIVTFLGLTGYIVYRLGAGSLGADWLVLGAGAFAGYVGSDFTSGLVHWGFDTWGSIYTPVVGASFIRPFREHHFDEKAITRHDFIQTNGNNCLVATPVLAATLLVPAVHGQPWGQFLATMLLFVCVGTMATNQIHKWSHTDEPPRLVAALQHWHLILPPVHHTTHHSAPFDNYYCITTGWLNAGLRSIRFFRVMERLVTAILGVQPRQDDLAR